MARERTYRYICFLLISLLPLCTMAEDDKQTPGKEGEKEKAPWVAGAAVGVDLVGFSMKAVGSDFANMEVMGRLNIKEKFFPIVELGIGDCLKKGGENDNKFSCTSPYWRVGLDYNINKKMNGNRFFAGGRYAMSSFKYDVYAPSLQDPIYGTDKPLDLKDISATVHWFEIVVGVETRIWSIVRLGWNFRYKMYLKKSFGDWDEPCLVPGYGKFGPSAFGGTVNVTFDIGKTAFQKTKKKIATEKTEKK